MLYPLVICATCIITSIVGVFFVKLGSNGSIMGALYKGLIATGLLSIVGLGIATQLTIGWGPVGDMEFTGLNLFFCGIVGLVVTGLIVWITEYYTGTDKRPVNSIAQASVTGHGTNVIQALPCRWNQPHCRPSSSLPALFRLSSWLVCSAMGIAVTAMLWHCRHDRCARCLRSGN